MLAEDNRDREGLDDFAVSLSADICWSYLLLGLR